MCNVRDCGCYVEQRTAANVNDRKRFVRLRTLEIFLDDSKFGSFISRVDRELQKWP